MLIQMIIECTDIDIYIRMCFLQTFYTFRSCNDTHKTHMFYTFIFQHLKCCHTGPACCKHRIYDKYFSFVTI